MGQPKTSKFYWACRNGDVDTVKNILSKLKPNDINQIESDGSTALHAASYYGHTSVVRLLLEHNADTTILNKYDKTAKEEASTEEVRTLFEKADDDEDDIPQSKLFQVYRNADSMDKLALATRIFKARLGTYQAHKYSISAASNMEHLEKLYRKKCEEKGNVGAIRMGEELFKAFRETGNFDHILTFYTKESPFYSIIHQDETFHIEMYKHLLRFDKYRVKCQTFRGAVLQPSDLACFQWAIKHPNSLIEIQKVSAASLDRDVALKFIPRSSASGQGVLFEFDLTQNTCFTAVKISSSLSHYPAEKEVLILPGTFFSISQINESDHGIIIISLINVPVDEKIILRAIKMFQKK